VPAADLAPLHRKLARAKSDLDALRANIDAYLITEPCRIENEVDGTTYALRTFVDREPEPEWAIDVAEIAVNARSVLDQLIWQLVIDNGAMPKAGANQFPIVVDATSYTHGRTSKRDRMLQGVASKHRRVIDSVQPFHRGRSADKDPLVIVDKIAKSEKHRGGHAVLGTASACRAKLTNANNEEMVISFKRAMPLTNNARMLAAENSPDPRFPDAVVRLELIDFAVDVGFRDEDDVYLLNDVERGVLAVTNIVGRCAARMTSC
jgi:hypothetical protein